MTTTATTTPTTLSSCACPAYKSYIILPIYITYIRLLLSRHFDCDDDDDDGMQLGGWRFPTTILPHEPIVWSLTTTTTTTGDGGSFFFLSIGSVSIITYILFIFIQTNTFVLRSSLTSMVLRIIHNNIILPCTPPPPPPPHLFRKSLTPLFYFYRYINVTYIC